MGHSPQTSEPTEALPERHQKRKRVGRTAKRLKDPPPEASIHGSLAKPSPAKRKRRTQDVRARVLRSALDCFSAFGYEGTSTRAVAHRAGVTHTLVLYHFRSKEQLWYAMMDEALGALVAVHPPAAQGSQSGAIELRAFIEHFVRVSARLPQIHRILTMEGTQESARLNWLVEHYLRHLYNSVQSMIRRGQAEGRVIDGDPARIYYHILGAASTPFAVPGDYRALTGRDVFSESEIHHTIAFIFDLIFK